MDWSVGAFAVMNFDHFPVTVRKFNEPKKTVELSYSR